MTSTSFRPRNLGPQYPVATLPLQNQWHGIEAQRVKNFTGQGKFQVPVAQDFANGMLPQGQATTPDSPTFKQFCEGVALMFSAMRRFLGEDKLPSPNIRKPG